MKAIIVPDLAYTSHKGRRGGSSNGYKEMSARLKYLQYRDDADGHIPQEQGLERWQDHGLGMNYREILNNCASLSSEKGIGLDVGAVTSAGSDGACSGTGSRTARYRADRGCR